MADVHGSCLCGAVAFTVDGPVDTLTHCHCSRCRKLHGTGFATYGMCRPEQFRLARGADAIVRYESSPGLHRAFCGRCGSVVPDPEPWQGFLGVPAGLLDDDPGSRPLAHIFVASKPSWDDVHDDLPRFDAYPPGVDWPTVPERPSPAPPDGVRGSCLCGGAAWVVTGPAILARYCHCSRCRKGRAAAYAANMGTKIDDVRFTRGAELTVDYRVPDARFFTQSFCRRCGSCVPRLDAGRGLAIVPLGALDDDPGVRPQAHIFVGSKAPWYTIADDLPRYEEYPPAS